MVGWILSDVGPWNTTINIVESCVIIIIHRNVQWVRMVLTPGSSHILPQHRFPPTEVELQNVLWQQWILIIIEIHRFIVIRVFSTLWMRQDN